MGGIALEKKFEKNLLLGCLCSFSIAFTMIIMLFVFGHYAPFGTKSMAFSDIDVSQLDLYAYLKDVLAGKNSLGYSFSMYLGGDTMNAFSYSMASPLNLLIVFFDKSQLHSFFDIMAALKIGFIASSMFYFLTKRFHNKLHCIFSYSLAIAYAFSQYVIAQTCNIFWLDGVFFLPLILWGMYRVIREHKSIFFASTIALSILFNWYTGIINCIFCIFWFFLEMFWYRFEKGTIKITEVVRAFIKTLIAGISGVLISLVLFLPTVMAVKQGNRGTVIWDYFSNTFNGNIITAFTNDTIGSLSTPTMVSLYCGSIAIIGCFCFFTDKKIEKWKKRLLGVFLTIVVMSFYWQPLTFVFSMFKNATSFWFRFGYIGIFTVVFVAANYYLNFNMDTRFELNASIFIFLYSYSIFFFNKDTEGYSLKLLYASVFFNVVFMASLIYWSYSRQSRRNILSSIMIFLVVCIEMGYNTRVLLPHFSVQNIKPYEAYTKAESKLIDSIKENDKTQYRITQTYTRNMIPRELTANYNESFGYGYWSIAGYTNSPDDMQRNFFDKAGYRINGENMYIVNTSILPIDSLLGVKYLLSDYEISGYQKMDSYGVVNHKSVYVNPYAFPMAFLHYKQNKLNIDKQQNQNPFEYQNNLYSSLIGKETRLFTKVNYSVANKYDQRKITFNLDNPEGDYAIYGNLPWNTETSEVIYVDGKQITPYSCWLSPAVFYIPNEKNNRTVTVEVSSEKGVSINDTQFYALNLNTLKELREDIIADSIDKLDIQNGNVKMEFDSEEGQEVFTSIPYNSAWKVTDNGKIIKPRKFANCLMVLPVSSGHHVIEMHYHVPGARAGIISMMIGFILLILIFVTERKRNNRRIIKNEK
jgi:uncharacterized membrane protein YfhO